MSLIIQSEAYAICIAKMAMQKSSKGDVTLLLSKGKRADCYESKDKIN